MNQGWKEFSQFGNLTIIRNRELRWNLNKNKCLFIFDFEFDFLGREKKEVELEPRAGSCDECLNEKGIFVKIIFWGNYHSLETEMEYTGNSVTKMHKSPSAEWCDHTWWNIKIKKEINKYQTGQTSRIMHLSNSS